MIARGVMGRGERVLSEEGVRHIEESTWPLVAIIAIASFAMVACFSPWPWRNDSPWEMVAAIATSAAVIVALMFSLKEARLRDRDRKARADIALELVRAELVVLRGMLRAAQYQLAAMVRVREGLPFSILARPVIDGLLKELDLTASTSSLESLIYCSGDEGRKVARLKGYCAALRRACEGVRSIVGRDAHNGSNFTAYRAFEQLNSTGSLLEEILGIKGDPYGFGKKHASLEKIVFGEDAPSSTEK